MLVVGCWLVVGGWCLLFLGVFYVSCVVFGVCCLLLVVCWFVRGGWRFAFSFFVFRCLVFGVLGVWCSGIGVLGVGGRCFVSGV